jgi:superfamily II DNA or RNA helicase
LLMTLSTDRVRLLIADAVGTGKSVEAGLIVAELIARGLAQRVLVCVPAPLREQWRDSLDHFFHLDSTIVAGPLLPALERRLLPGQSVWSAHDIVVASIDYLKTRPETVLSHSWDVVLIDEAHLCARPHTYGTGRLETSPFAVSSIRLATVAGTEQGPVGAGRKMVSRRAPEVVPLSV